MENTSASPSPSPSPSSSETLKGARWLVWYLGERKTEDGTPILSEWEEDLAHEVAWIGLEGLGINAKAF